MTPTETVLLAEYVRACCPQQAFGEYTPDAWHDLLGDLDLADCRQAVAEVAKRQPFVAPAEIRAEVKRVREERLAREILPPPPPEPGPYKAVLDEIIKEIADGRSVHRAIGGPVRQGEPPAEWKEARAQIPAIRSVTPQEKARQQVAESRAARAHMDNPAPEEDPAA